MSNGLDVFLDATGKLVKTIPTLYEDLAQPAVQETGKFIARIPTAINAALSGIDCWIEGRNYRIKETKKLLEKKLENVDPDKIVPPDSYVAIPALEAISNSMDSEELRNMYANLLANAMNIDTKDSVHPSFVEIIKQLSPLDAQVIKYVRDNAFKLATITFRFQRDNLTPNLGFTNGSIGFEVVSNAICIPLDEMPYHYIQMSLDNLLRLGLIHIDYSKYLDDQTLYDNILEAFSESVEELVKETFNDPKYEDYKIVPAKGRIYSNTLFKIFCDVCV